MKFLKKKSLTSPTPLSTVPCHLNSAPRPLDKVTILARIRGQQAY